VELVSTAASGGGSKETANDAKRVVRIRPGNLEPLLTSKLSHTGRCGKCGAAPGDPGVKKLKYCTMCFSTVYCNSECSKAHWKTHKPECARRQESLVRIDRKKAREAIGDLSIGTINYSTGKSTCTSGGDGGGTSDSAIGHPFTIKVQIPMTQPHLDARAAAAMRALNGRGEWAGAELLSAMCYNESRDVHVMVSVKMGAEYESLVRAVEEKGMRMNNSARGVKAYFTARLLDSGEVLLVDTHAPVEPPPPW